MAQSIKHKMLTNFQDVKKWLEDNHVSDFLIHDDLTVSVNGDVDLSYYNLSFLPVQFYKVKGKFNAHKNKLRTLEGFPQEAKSVTCYNNRLTSLKGAPKRIEDVFNVTLNPLKTLEGMPHYIGSMLIIDAKKVVDYSALFSLPLNELTFYIENLPKEISKYFNESKMINKSDFLIYLEKNYLNSTLAPHNMKKMNKVKL